MKIRPTVFVLLIWCAVCSCHDAKVQDVDTQPSLNAEAVLIERDESGLTQVLLRMELMDYGGDLLKFGLRDVQEHQERLSYYLMQFKQDIFLVNQGDTLSCVDSHLERTNMDAPYRNFMLNFHSPEDLSSPELMIYETQFSNKLLQLSILNDDQR